MEKNEKMSRYTEYRQEDGTPTARLPDRDPLTELSHEGSLFYKRLFYLLISIGCLYLTGVFYLFH